MWPYWLMFLLPAWIAYSGHDRTIYLPNGLPRLALPSAWLGLLFVMTGLVGLRMNVGGDWNNYYRVFETLQGKSLNEVISMGDPGYQLLNWWVQQAGWNILGVNLVAGLIFSIGLVVFSRSQPKPWLAFAVAVPYLVIVVAMGYTRQGISVGLGMLGLVALERRAITWFAIWVILAVTFHKSAILLFPIAALSATRNRIWAVVWIGTIAVVTFRLLVEQEVETLYTNYVEAQFQSEGALVRLAMNAIPATIILAWRKRFHLIEEDWAIWRVMAVIALALLALYFVSPASTALDRIGLYLIPLQLMVFSHVPDAFGRPNASKQDWVGIILIYYGAVLFTWLNFATHSRFWIPYRTFPLI